MKLHTDIRPRRDGTVIAQVAASRYVFAADASGQLTAEVADEHASLLLDTGNFYPGESAELVASHTGEEGDEDAPPARQPRKARK